MASMVFAMGARRPEGSGGCGGGQPTPRDIEWRDVLWSTTITPLEHRQSSTWRSTQVDEHAGTLDSPSGSRFSTHAGVYGLRWWGDENSVLVVLSNLGGFERAWVNDDYERPQEYNIQTNFEPFAPVSSRFPESIYEIRSVDIGECSTRVRFNDPSDPTGALAQMIDQGIANAIRDGGGPWTHVDLQADRPSHFEVRLRQEPEDVGDFPSTGLLPNDDFCFDAHYRVSRIGINGRCNVGGFSLHFCGRPTVDSRWQDFDASGLPGDEVPTITRVQRGDFDFVLTEALEVHQDFIGDSCAVGGLPSSSSLAERFTRDVPPSIADALNDQTWQDSAPEALPIDQCPYRRRHPDWTDLEARSHCANVFHVQVDRVRCGDDTAAGVNGDCEFRAEPDRVAFLPSAMTIVLAECAGIVNGGDGTEDPTPACPTPDPQGFLFRAAGSCGADRLADANAVPLSFDISPTVSAH